MCSIAAGVWLAGMVLGQPAFGQSLNRDQMRTITHLSCVFPLVSEAAWSPAAVPQSPRVRTDAPLAFEIEDIDIADGSAVITGSDADAEVIVKLFGWSLHFLDNGRPDAIAVTTVFAETSQNGKLRAVRSESRFQAGVEARPGDVAASQFYGECEATRK